MNIILNDKQLELMKQTLSKYNHNCFVTFDPKIIKDFYRLIKLGFAVEHNHSKIILTEKERVFHITDLGRVFLNNIDKDTV